MIYYIRNCDFPKTEYIFALNTNVNIILPMVYLFNVFLGKITQKRKEILSGNWYIFSKAFMVKSHQLKNDYVR